MPFQSLLLHNHSPHGILQYLHLLRLAKEATAEQEFLSLEQAVHKLTYELAEWFGLDTGYLEVGTRADMAIIDPDGLDDALDSYHEAPMPGMNIHRMVRRNDGAVAATVIGGKVAFTRGQFADDFGQVRYGRFLRAGVTDRAPIAYANTTLAATG